MQAVDVLGDHGVEDPATLELDQSLMRGVRELVAERREARAVEAPEPARVAPERVDRRDLHRVDVLPDPAAGRAEVRDPGRDRDARPGQRDDAPGAGEHARELARGGRLLGCGAGHGTERYRLAARSVRGGPQRQRDPEGRDRDEHDRRAGGEVEVPGDQQPERARSRRRSRPRPPSSPAAAGSPAPPRRAARSAGRAPAARRRCGSRRRPRARARQHAPVQPLDRHPERGGALAVERQQQERAGRARRRGRAPRRSSTAVRHDLAAGSTPSTSPNRNELRSTA